MSVCILYHIISQSGKKNELIKCPFWLIFFKITVLFRFFSFSFQPFVLGTQKYKYSRPHGPWQSFWNVFLKKRIVEFHVDSHSEWLHAASRNRTHSPYWSQMSSACRLPQHAKKQMFLDLSILILILYWLELVWEHYCSIQWAVWPLNRWLPLDGATAQQQPES